MKVATLTTIICFFSVLIRIQSDEIVYVYNYSDFGELFHQGDQDDFNVYKYEDIDTVFDEKYYGPNIGGAVLLNGGSKTRTPPFDGYIVDITASFYCGSKEFDNMRIYVIYADGKYDDMWLCGDARIGWTYYYTWIPPMRFSHSEVSI